jgi:hypothetical protein
VKLAQFNAFAAEKGGLNLRHEHLRLRGQAVGNGIEGGRFAPGEKRLDRPFAGVVGGQGQAPIFEMTT